MKRTYFGIVATVVVLAGLAVAYLYRGQLGQAVVAPATTAGSAAEPAQKEGDKNEEKAPVSRVAQTALIWPGDKPPMSAQAEPASVGEHPADGAPAPTVDKGAAQASAERTSPVPAATAPNAADANSAPEAPDQHDTRAEAPPAEHGSADTRTAQTALLAAGRAPQSQVRTSEAPAATDSDSAKASISPAPDSGQGVVASPALASAADVASVKPAEEEPMKSARIKGKPAQREGGVEAASRGKKTTPLEDRPFDAATSWWPAVGHEGNSLSLVYAGEAAFDKAIVLLFSKTVSADAGGQIRLTDGTGKPVSGSWSVSPKNPQMLICKVPSGRYLVSIPPDFADSAGEKFGSSLQGPVYVH